jgi:hypothetical protein
VTGTWGAPILPSGLDQFTADQQPDPRPVDDLSRFVMSRIRFAESEPAVDMVPKSYSRPGGAMTHRYAGNVRRDMVVFRRIVQLYVESLADDDSDPYAKGDGYQAGARSYMEETMLVLANRFADHPDFRDEWRLE